MHFILFNGCNFLMHMGEISQRINRPKIDKNNLKVIPTYYIKYFKNLTKIHLKCCIKFRNKST